MDQDATTAPRMKLPIWRTAQAAFLVIAYNPLIAVKLGIVPFVLFLASGLTGATLFAGENLQDLAVNPTASHLAVTFGLPLIAQASTIPMVTAWHRLVLIGHGGEDARLRYSVTGSEWLYLWKAVLFYLLMMLVGFIATLIFGVIAGLLAAVGTEGRPSTMMAVVIGLMMFPVFGLVVGCILRFSLVFPSAAIGKPLGFFDSWHATAGNTWRMLFVLILVTAPFWILSMLASAIFFGFQISPGGAIAMPTLPEQIVLQLITTPIWIIGICVGVSFWSWSYHYLIENRPITLPDD